MRYYSTLGGVRGSVARFTCDAVTGRVASDGACNCQPGPDPTNTYADRTRGRLYLEAQLVTLKKLIRTAIVQQDALGTGSAKLTTTGWTFTIMGGAFDRESILRTMFASMVQSALLDPAPAIIQKVAGRGYRAGLIHGRSFFPDAIVDPLRMRQSVSKVYSDVQDEMQGIADALVQHLARAGRDAVQTKIEPLSLFQILSGIVDRIGSQRLRALVETVVVHAHALATLDIFEAAGLTQVGTVPETLPTIVIEDAARKKKPKQRANQGPGSRLKGRQPSKSTLYRIRKAQAKIERFKRVDVLTAGDDRVCQVCEDIAEDGPYSINQARQLIPAHPRCRCVFIPA